ncbi:hypothetical protein ACM66Z_07080 [Sulfurovum sp. ST-21]|uniref:Uncharacterized protein n=1 Tax=Sulfurovum indicum TaxID=2779528 RepID=A0A7M1S163_9BACT|nr:hypothetical protein [Sulfurovum indicum]QOR61215.1 hypothetical protein IMZ28_07075 [Sulfurovum indicum]
MQKYTNSVIVFGLLLFSWGFGSYVYPLMNRAEAYGFFLFMIAGVVWILRKKLGWKWVWTTFLGLFVIAVLFILTSPHRLHRLKSWTEWLMG